jgi:tRNA(Ile)-lysidine synthase
VIRLSFKLPSKIAIAVSGGADSMAALDFLRQNRQVKVLHFNHGTPGADPAQRVVTNYCDIHDLELEVGYLDEVPDSGQSIEDFWRRARYSFFEDARGNLPVVTCHHLDDVAETWLFTSLNGNPNLIPSKRGNYLRPFLETRKAMFEDWCDRKNVPFHYDSSNEDTRFMRNYIRHELIPKALRVNPGLHKVLRRKIRKDVDSHDEAVCFEMKRVWSSIS